MKIVFVSNYLNHHQLPLCEAFIKENVDFKFISIKRISEERRILNYEEMDYKYDFVVRGYENDENYKLSLDLCLKADVAIISGAQKEFIKRRANCGKITFVYSERIYKEKVKAYKLPCHFFKHIIYKYHKANVYLLCASSFASADFSKSFTFLNRCYKWGYFPEIKRYFDVDKMFSEKKKNSILWVGRFIDWKHPDSVIEIARRLKKDGYSFSINIIGTGEEEEKLKSLIIYYGLENEVMLLGSMSSEKVRDYMENSEIFLFTSDRNEGWGAVLNESMNSGCAVIASHIIGSVPFLISDGENGMIYKDGDVENLYAKVKFLLDNPQKRAEIGKSAYTTLCEQWNAENAADRLIKLSQKILNGNKSPEIYDSGVCSKAKIIKDNWYSK